MGKTRSRRPAEETHSARRSLVDLTVAVKQAVEDGLLAPSTSSVDALAEHPRRPDTTTEKPERADVPEQVILPIDATAAAPPPARGSRDRECAASDSAAAMMVQIAKDYHSTVLDGIKAGLNTALDHAKEFAETARAGEAAGEAGRQKDVLGALGAAAAVFRTEALDLMEANVAAALDYAKELGGTRTAAEFVELSATQARKSCELMLKQADAVKSLAQAIATDRADHED
jgi:hypothetical protein